MKIDTMKLMRDMLTTAYEELKNKQVAFYLENKHALELKRDLEDAVLKGTASGEIVGKNAKEREASAKEKHADLFQSLEDASDKAGGEKLRLDLAQLDVDLARAMIRLEEIQVGRLPDAGH